MLRRLRQWILGILVEALSPHLDELRAIRAAIEQRPGKLDYMPKLVGGTKPLEPFGPITGTKIF